VPDIAPARANVLTDSCRSSEVLNDSFKTLGRPPDPGAPPQFECLTAFFAAASGGGPSDPGGHWVWSGSVHTIRL
jgi:hypothetical protein